MPPTNIDTTTVACPSTRHDAFVIANAKEIEDAMTNTMMKVFVEARDESLRLQSRLAEFHRNPRRMTVAHVSIQIIDEEITENGFVALADFTGNRFWQVYEFAKEAFTKWRRIYSHERG